MESRPRGLREADLHKVGAGDLCDGPRRPIEAAGPRPSRPRGLSETRDDFPEPIARRRFDGGRFQTTQPFFRPDRRRQQSDQFALKARWTAVNARPGGTNQMQIDATGWTVVDYRNDLDFAFAGLPRWRIPCGIPDEPTRPGAQHVDRQLHESA